MVVIKGVKTFQNSVTVEYSDLDIMQMLGRAVRSSLMNDSSSFDTHLYAPGPPPIR